MTEYFLRLFLKEGSPRDPGYRRRCGALSGWVGIVLNLLLFLGKLGAGLATASVAIVADAVNNLSDAASSVVTLVGFRLAGLEADADHPFGHGRIEYVSGLVVSLAILLMGLEVGRASLTALFRPETLSFSPAAVGILCAAILVKLWLFRFNRLLGRRIGSAAMEATAADSLSDALSTGLVLLSTLVFHFWGLRLDGLAGLVVAALILKAGWEAARDTLDPLLGRPMDPRLARDIDALVRSHDSILGIHDLIYHDYGPVRAMMSFHAEVPAEGDFLALHEQVDHIERELKSRYGIDTVIHMDPVLRDERTLAFRNTVELLARGIDPALTIHDFRLTPGPDHVNVFFDLTVPYGFRLTPEQAGAALEEKLRAVSPSWHPVIQAEHPFVEEAP